MFKNSLKFSKIFQRKNLNSLTNFDHLLSKNIINDLIPRYYSSFSKPSILNTSIPKLQKDESPYQNIKTLKFEQKPSLEQPVLPDFNRVPLNGSRSNEKKTIDPVASSKLYNLSVPVMHPKNDSEIKRTKLPNGVTVATVETNSNISSISLTFDKAGTKFDPIPGFAIVANKLAFTNQLSNNESLEDLCCDALVDSSTKLYFASVERSEIEDRIKLLANQIVNPNFSQDEIDNVVNNINMSIDEEYNNPATSQVFEDAIRKACFGTNQAAGQPMLAKINNKINKNDLVNYIKQIHRPENCVVVGLGVDHDNLVKIIEKYLVFDQNLPIVEPYNLQTEDWVGGDVFHEFSGTALDLYKQNIPTLQSLAIAFNSTESRLTELAVLESILGGGASFSAGGPGKGLLSIIHTDILCRFPLNFAYASIFEGPTFTIRAGATSEYAQYIPHAIVEICASVMERITDEDLNRGKRRLQFAILSGLENPRSLSGLITSNLIDKDENVRNNPGIKYILEKVDKVSLVDIKKTWKEMVDKPFAMAAVGIKSQFPSYDAIEQVFSHIRKENEKYNL